MSRSLRRATAGAESMQNLVGTARCAVRIATRCPYLRAAFENKSIQQQQDHGADDGHDPPGDVIFARKDATDPRPYECAGDAEQNGDDATAGISSRHQQFRDRTDDKTNKNSPND